VSAISPLPRIAMISHRDMGEDYGQLALVTK